jgi:hypothetical protein
MNKIEEMVIEITEELTDLECDDCRRLNLVITVVDLVFLNTYNIHESIGILEHVKNLVIQRYQDIHEEDYEI